LSRLSACHRNQTDALNQLPKPQQEFLKSCYKQFNAMYIRNNAITNTNDNHEYSKDQTNTLENENILNRKRMFSRKIEPEIKEFVEIAEEEGNIEALQEEDEIKMSTAMKLYDVEIKSKESPGFIASID